MLSFLFLSPSSCTLYLCSVTCCCFRTLTSSTSNMSFTSCFLLLVCIVCNLRFTSSLSFNFGEIKYKIVLILQTSLGSLASTSFTGILLTSSSLITLEVSKSTTTLRTTSSHFGPPFLVPLIVFHFKIFP